jgi:hypothetical protein
MWFVHYIRREVCEYSLILGRIQILVVIFVILFDVGRLASNDVQVKV